MQDTNNHTCSEKVFFGVLAGGLDDKRYKTFIFVLLIRIFVSQWIEKNAKKMEIKSFD